MKNVAVLSADEAVALIPDGAFLAYSGFGALAHPEQLSAAIERRFLATGKPEGLTVYFPAGNGGPDDIGVGHLGHRGLVKRSIGGHYGRSPKLMRLAAEGGCEAYNLPQGILSQLCREAAAKRPGLLTTVGMGTFVDPRLEGGKLNAITREDLVEVVQIGGQEYLFYKTPPITVALIRATYADEWGNISTEKEAVHTECVAAAQAAHNAGGLVLVQVEELVAAGSLHPKKVRIPGFMVDAVIIDPEQWQTRGKKYEPAFSGEARAHVSEMSPLPLTERKVIARRAAQELKPGMVINLGLGIPEGVGAIAAEQHRSEEFVMTIECGPIGGVPQSGDNFGASLNPMAVTEQPVQFDFYAGGGLDLTCLGLAEADEHGNINVSRFGPTIAGCGGFIDISQNAREVIFCGTLTAGSLKTEIFNGQLRIAQEGRQQKFVKKVEQITFSGDYARQKGQRVLYVTERAVFEMRPEGLTLIEIAPGIRLEQDILAQMQFQPYLAENLRLMDRALFEE
jgi:propionate CoA-transferase